MFYVYILQSKLDNSFYIGQTKNLDSRMSKHNFGRTKSYTIRKRPWILVYTEKCQTRMEARKRESYLKGLKNRIYLEKIIKENTGR